MSELIWLLVLIAFMVTLGVVMKWMKDHSVIKMGAPITEFYPARCANCNGLLTPCQHGIASQWDHRSTHDQACRSGGTRALHR
jgi:hypothetical protein